MEALLRSVFPDGVPDVLDAARVHQANPSEFGAGPIYSSSGRHRFYVADRHDPKAWESAVRGLGAGPFLRPCGRRMLDTDGTHHEVYLDDLHQADGGSVMCEILCLSDGERSTVTLVEEVPERFEAYAALASLGRVALRDGAEPHLIWITEARHTGLLEECEALARSLFELPPAYDALRRARRGVYVDALDVLADGTLDLTPGFLPE